MVFDIPIFDAGKNPIVIHDFGCANIPITFSTEDGKKGGEW